MRLGLVEHHLGHLHVARRLLVEGRSDHLGLRIAGYLGHLRTLVDQQHDDVDLGMVVGDGVDDRLHEHRLTRLGLGDDRLRAGPLADGREEVDDARRHVVVAVAREAEFCSLGKSGVMNSGCARSRMYSGARPLISLTPAAKYFSHALLRRKRIAPLVSRLQAEELICEGET